MATPSPSSENPNTAPGNPTTVGDIAGPPAPGRTAPGPFPAEPGDQPDVVRFTSAWGALLHSIGYGIQGGLARSAEARRIIRGR